MDLPRNLLMIEDNPDDREVILRLFDRYGAKNTRVTSAGTLSDGINYISKKVFDIVLMDLNLPDSEGLSTLTAFVETAPYLPIVVLTGLADEAMGIAAVGMGAQDYLSKGKLDVETLSRSLRYAIERKRIEGALQKTTDDLKETVNHLEKANHMILEQQKSLVEEERLKVLLQMAGATAHELSQPLMALLCSIDLLKEEKSDPASLPKYIDRIETAGRRIADIVRKIQTIRHDESIPYCEDSSITNIHQKINIVCIQDSDKDFSTIANALKDNDRIRLIKADGIENAIGQMATQAVDLVFSDYFLSDGNGLDLLTQMTQAGLRIPVVIITAKGNETIALQIIKAGAYDYLPVRRVSRTSLSRCILHTLEKAKYKKDAEKARRELVKMATVDSLTGLYNRRYFMETMERDLNRAQRYNTSLAVMMLDLDHFKRINDTYGHAAGDMVLSETGRMLRQNIRQCDIACRYGGEEFAVMLPETDTAGAGIIAERIREKIKNRQFEYQETCLQVSVSIGLAMLKSIGPRTTADELLKKADEALYRAKNAGRNRVISVNS